MAVRIRTTARFRSDINQPVGSASLLVGNNIAPRMHRYDWFPEAGEFGAKAVDPLLGPSSHYAQQIRCIEWDAAARNAVCAVGDGTTNIGTWNQVCFRLTLAGLNPISTIARTGVSREVALDPVEGVAIFTSYAANGGGIYQYTQAGFGSLITASNAGGATISTAICPATKRVAFGRTAATRLTYHPYSLAAGIPGPIVWTGDGIGDVGLVDRDVNALTFTADGSRLIVGYNTTPRVAVFATDSLPSEGLESLTQTFVIPTTVDQVRLNPQETILAVAGNTALLLYRWSDGNIVSTLRGITPAGTVQCFDWSPDGRYIAVGLTSTPWVQVFRVDDTGVTFACQNPATNPGGSVNAVKFAY